MMSYDKYERGCQHLSGGHQRITYKRKKEKQKTKIKIKIILTLWLTQNNQWVGVDHAARIHLLNSPPMTGSVEKNKMIVMMTIFFSFFFLFVNDLHFILALLMSRIIFLLSLSFISSSSSSLSFYFFQHYQSLGENSAIESEQHGLPLPIDYFG